MVIRHCFCAEQAGYYVAACRLCASQFGADPLLQFAKPRAWPLPHMPYVSHDVVGSLHISHTHVPKSRLKVRNTGSRGALASGPNSSSTL